MPITKLFPVLLAGTLLTACASTGEGEPALAKAEVANPDEITCRTVVKTGTRIGTKVCKTNRAWAAGSRSGRNMAEDIQRKSMQGLADPNYGN